MNICFSLYSFSYSLFNRLFYAVIFLCVIIISSHLSYASNDPQLDGMKQEISRQSHLLNKQKKELSTLQQKLKKYEISISDTSNKIRSAQKELLELDRSIATLKGQSSKLIEQQEKQKEELKELLINFYLTSRSNQISNLLNDNGMHKLDRLAQYTKILSETRVDAISQLHSTEQKLKEKETALVEQQQRQNQLIVQYKQDNEKLKLSQQQRKKTLAKIKQGISTDTSYLLELQENEKRLKAAIVQAEKDNHVPMDGLTKHKGDLPWPISNARIIHNYGTQQTGELTWKGMVLASTYGEPVKAVYSGKVVFSDWLRGYGLMILIDHGKGYMTLYGYNQSLLKKVGDNVNAGETIAIVGNSGGQDRPSLYFEIRHDSKAQNPRRWLN